MKWKRSPIIKIYEALGAVADERIAVTGNTAKVYSSSGNKYYDVAYDRESNAIMANDNGSYWKGYLGYPAVAYLLSIGVLDYRPELAALLKGIKWKDVNQQFKNDFEKTLAHINASLPTAEADRLAAYARELETKLASLNLSLLGPKLKPPTGY